MTGHAFQIDGRITSGDQFPDDERLARSRQTMQQHRLGLKAIVAQRLVDKAAVSFISPLRRSEGIPARERI